MKCEQATRQLRKDFINKVHRHATDPYYAHLLGCHSCRQQQEYLQQMYTLFQDETKVRLPDTLIAELQVYCSENISSSKQKKKRRIGFLFWPAVIAGCLAVVAFYLQQSGKMVQVQDKIAKVSSEWKQTVSQWIDQVSERSEEMGDTVMEKVGFAKEAVMQTVTGQDHVHSDGNFDKISKNLNQSVNAQLNPKAMPQKNSVQGLKQDNTLFDKSPGENVVDTETLDEGVNELGQQLAQQKQQKKFVPDTITNPSEEQLEANDEDLEASNTEDNVPSEANAEIAGEDGNSLEPALAVLQSKPIDQNENVDPELQPCALATEFNNYNGVGFGETPTMSLATEMPEETSPEDFILSSARRFYRLNWGKQEMGVMGSVVLSPSIPTNTTMAIDVVTKSPETDVLTALKSQFDPNANNGSETMKLTLNKPLDSEDIELQQLIQELDAENLMNQNAVETFASDDLKIEPILDPDEVAQVLDKYHLQYCEEDPEIMRERQYSFNE